MHESLIRQDNMRTDSHRKSEKKYKAKLKENGLCINCGQLEPEEGKFKCNSCLSINRDYTNGRSKMAKLNGKCYSCKHRDKLPDCGSCEECWYKTIARNNGFRTDQWTELKKKMEYQNHTCPYTGVKLVKGINASIDHIKPKKRFPELYRDLSNVEWICLDINMSKRDKTKEEFLEMCETIIKRLK